MTTTPSDRFTTYHGLMPDSTLEVSTEPGARALIVSEHDGANVAAIMLDGPTIARVVGNLTAPTLAEVVDTLAEGETEEPASHGGRSLTYYPRRHYGSGTTDHEVASRHHLALGYYGHRVRLADGQQLTVYVSHDGVLSVDVGLNTAVRIRHGRGPHTRYAADTAPLLPFANGYSYRGAEPDCNAEGES